MPTPKKSTKQEQADELQEVIQPDLHAETGAQAVEVAESAEVAQPYRGLILFTSPSCGPCKQMKPIISKLQEAHGFELKILSFDESTQGEFTQFGIRNVPALLAVDCDKVIDRSIGFNGEGPLVSLLQSWNVIA